MSDRSQTHPMMNPALAVELTLREREAWMTADDWNEQVDVLLSKPPVDLSRSAYRGLRI